MLSLYLINAMYSVLQRQRYLPFKLTKQPLGLDGITFSRLWYLYIKVLSDIGLIILCCSTYDVYPANTIRISLCVTLL